MLKNLSIRNYALIESLDLEFSPGLTTITGETGAGKSIMLGALSMLMGGRADSKVISDGNAKCSVEALFTDVDPTLRSFVEEHGIDWSEPEPGVAEITIRRQIAPSGRSKVYVNDTAVTLQTLSLLAANLIDIHSQRANTRINDASMRLDIIDALAANAELRADYRRVFDEYVEVRRRIARRKKEMQELAENLDFMRFQLEQLDRLAPKTGELSEIERRYDLLSDADDIRDRLAAIIGLLDDNGTGASSRIAEAAGVASKIDIEALIPGFDRENVKPIAERLADVLIEVRDICDTVETAHSAVDSDPEMLSRLSDRMNLYYETVKRFRVKEADELVGLRESLRAQVNAVTLGDEALPALEQEGKRLAHLLKQRADALTESRRKAAAGFSKSVCDTARPLGLPNINFEAVVLPRKLSATGQDEVEFLCSFNKNGTPQPVSAIASGGEVSRLMLSMKAIVAHHINLPTIIFDEVDTGVSGEIADKMGDMMRDMGLRMQVVTITHLPQVAAKGKTHFKVYKSDEAMRTVTHVRQLTVEERIREIAGMISGSDVSEAALEAARQLLTLDT